jgi:hypothetical protein
MTLVPSEDTRAPGISQRRGAARRAGAVLATGGKAAVSRRDQILLRRRCRCVLAIGG